MQCRLRSQASADDAVTDSKEASPAFRDVLRGVPMDFWRLWYVGLVVSTVRWLETVVMGVVVYQQTESP